MDTAIRTRKLGKSFFLENKRQIRVLKQIDLEVNRGELTILKGRSGSGKTTLLNLLSTLDEPTAGKIEFLGKDLAALTRKEKEKLRSTKMGFVFQSIALVPLMTSYENVDFALRLAEYQGNRDKRIRELLNRVGLGSRMYHMTSRLSGGEQQRVAIARAVAHHPAVVFADEPTGALDTASGLAVMGLFKELVEKEGITVLMTTHDPELMELGDRVYELQDGRIAGSEGRCDVQPAGEEMCDGQHDEDELQEEAFYVRDPDRV